MTPEQVAERHEDRHRLCEHSCAIMAAEKDVPEVVVPCAVLCQGKRWESVDKKASRESVWAEG